MEKIKRSVAWRSLLVLVTALCLLVGGTGTAAAEPTQADRVPTRIHAYTPGGFLPGANGKAVILGSVSATWPDGSYTDLSGATVSLYSHPTSKADRESGDAAPLAQTTTDEKGVYQFTVEVSPSQSVEFDTMIEYGGSKSFMAVLKILQVPHTSSVSWSFAQSLLLRPIMTRWAIFRENWLSLRCSNSSATS